jgi:short subunit dehydrogenase-like uncharacterized protein
MPTNSKKWMIYGATGFSGQMIARTAKSRGLIPILAGRDPKKLEPLAKELGLEMTAFSVNNDQEILEATKGIQVLLNCAGPFHRTYQQILAACLKNHVHYLDITGEASVFEDILFNLENKIKAAGIVAVPGVGFDVVPSDCLALSLKEKLPDANHLKFASYMKGKLSPGTMKTMIQYLPNGGLVRENHQLIPVPLGYKIERFQIAGDNRYGTTISWGDLSTAYFSTGIPNIEFFLTGPLGDCLFFKFLNPLRPLIKTEFVQKLLNSMTEKHVSGPDETSRANSSCWLWAQVTNEKGEKAEQEIRLVNGYDLTADAAVCAVQEVLNNNFTPGAWTPSRLFGSDFIKKLKGVEFLE